MRGVKPAENISLDATASKSLGLTRTEPAGRSCMFILHFITSYQTWHSVNILHYSS